jgi:hypothetical protein
MVYWLLLLNGSPAMSQDVQLAGFNYTRFPGVEVKDSHLNQKLEVSEYNFFLNFPRRLKNDKTIMINGLEYRSMVPSGYNDLNQDLDGQNLYVIGYRLTMLHQLQNDWRVLISLNPTLSSSFNTALEGDDFLINGALQFVRKKSDRFSYGGGIARTARFGEPKLIPTLMLKFNSQNNQLRVLLPHDISYDQYFGKLTAGFQIMTSGSRYNVNYAGINSFYDIEFVDKLAYSRVFLGTSLSYRVGKALQLQASGGITMARGVELQRDEFEDVNYDLANGPFFRFGVAIIPSDKDKK